ncbi:acyltransferase family protein [Microbacterium gilvum]|uniref:Acyltransferase family protein n=2 Tax=Microbacterium gilvum TaxID=1336204 RepID=A0ABP9A8T6_9MICO
MRLDIQGLRAIAVLAVLLDHARIPGFAGGYVGVDVFFVVSGFLITGHLLRELREHGRIRFAAFWARRARRLLPAALSVLAATTGAALVLMSPLRLETVLHDAVATALYVPNLRFAALQTDYLAGTEPSPFQHYWSLGVEEQFYLLWPLVLAGLWLALRRRTAGPGIGLGVGIGATAVLSFAACVVVGASSQPWAFFSLPTRAWELAVGGLVAWAGMRRGAREGGVREGGARERMAAVAAWAGLAAIGASVAAFDAATPWPGPATLAPVLGTAAVIAFGQAQGGPAALLSVPPAVFVGGISYALYLVHWPIMVLVAERMAPGSELTAGAGAACIVLAVLLAWPLHRQVEERFRRPRVAGRPRADARALVGALAASLVLVAVLTGSQAAVALRPLDAGRSAPTSAELAPLPSGTPFVPDNLAPALADAAADTGEVYGNGCQQGRSAAELVTCDVGEADADVQVALFGDSHAGRLFPALARVAEEEGYLLRTYLKSGCRSLETEAGWEDARPDCAQWREEALTALEADPPDVVVLASHVPPMPGRDPATLQGRWEAGVAAVLDRLPEESRPVLVQDNPGLAFSAPLCLSSHLSSAASCGAERDEALNAPVRAAIARVGEAAGAPVVDTVDLMCDAERCPAIIGATLVYSDDHHLTATFAAQLAPAIGAGIEEALAVSAAAPSTP